MGTMLNSKTFLAAEDEHALVRDAISHWIAFNLELGKAYDINIRIKTADKGRKHKSAAREELKNLLPDDNFSWGYTDYEFYFGQRHYLWKRKEIHVTPSEALFLYRVLVLKDIYTYKFQPFHLTHMRQKFGKEFLADISEVVKDEDKKDVKNKGKSLGKDTGANGGNNSRPRRKGKRLGKTPKKGGARKAK